MGYQCKFVEVKDVLIRCMENAIPCRHSGKRKTGPCNFGWFGKTGGRKFAEAALTYGK